MLKRIRRYRYERLMRKGRQYMSEAKASLSVTGELAWTEQALKCFERAAALFSSRDEAPEAYEKAAQCCVILAENKLSEAGSLFVSLSVISEIYEEADDYLRRAEQYGRSVGDKRMLCLTCLADNEVKRQNYGKAERLYNEAVERFDSMTARNRLYRCRYLQRLAEADEQRKGGNHAEALRLYGEALDNLTRFDAKDDDKIQVYRNAEKCCRALGDEDGASRYVELYTPLLPLIERIGGEKAWIGREDMLDEFMRRAQDAFEDGNRKLAVEYCEEAARLYLSRESVRALSDTWEPDEKYFDVFALLMRSLRKDGAIQPTGDGRATVALGISVTNNFTVKRRLYELWETYLKAEKIDALTCLDVSAYCKHIDVGSTVLFGSYPQEDTSEEKRLPIEWEVLDVKGHDLLLVSRYALDVVPYQADGENVPWEETTLCRWLNGEFLDRAFSGEEREFIGKEGVSCLSFGNLWAYYDNERYGWLGTYGEETVFSHLMVADGTPYALAKGLYRWHFDDYDDFDLYDSIWHCDETERESLHFNSADPKQLYGRRGVCWWIRADRDYTGRLVTQDGVANKEYHSADIAARRDVGVRPALWFTP